MAFGLNLALNLGNLFFFKYFYLFADFIFLLVGEGIGHKETVNALLSDRFGIPEIILPLAISFYTFQMIAYTVDLKRGEAQENPSFLEFLLFIMFFPQLVAGPIVRHSQFFGQLKTWNSLPGQVESGIALILFGLLKKIVLADNLAMLLDPIFLNPGEFNAISLTLALFGYLMQIFFDFSGYTDLARGFGKLLGIELPENFAGPYFSRGFGEFWTKWHLTLSTWIRDYLFIPLGGSRVPPWRNAFNLTLTMFLAGLWHGANFTFAIWGLVQGVLVATERALAKHLQQKASAQGIPPKVTSTFSWQSILGFLYFFITFGILAAFFRASKIEDSFLILGRMFSGESGKLCKSPDQIFIFILLGLFFNYLQINTKWQSWIQETTKQRIFLVAASLVMAWLLGLYTPEGADFIYFQF